VDLSTLLARLGPWLIALALACALAPVAHAAAAGAVPIEVALWDGDAGVAAPPPAATSGDPGTWRPMPRTLPYRKQGSWVRVTVQAPAEDARLVVESFVVGRVTAVWPDGRHVERSKLRRDPDNDASPVALVFPLPRQLAPGTTLLLHFEHRYRAFTQVHLDANEAWKVRERETVLLAAVLYSALTVFALVTACFWLMVRERIYLLYSLFILGWWVYMASTTGPLYWLPGGEGFARTGIEGQWSLLCLVTALGQRFASDMLELPRVAPRLSRWFDLLVLGLFVASVIVLLAPWPMPWFGMTIAAVVFVLFFSTVVLGIYVANRTRDRYALYFIVGWTPMMVGGLLRILQASGMLATSDSVSYLYAIGVLVQAMVLMVGLADRMLFVRRERDLARWSARRANEASEAKSVFLANMSHELRTPLNAVLGFARLMRRSAGLSRADHDSLSIIHKSGEHLLELINQVLSISKIEAGGMTLVVRPFDLRELLFMLERMFLARCEEVGLGFRLELDPALPPAVQGDAAKLRQVLINLLGNAVKFTRSGSVILRAHARDGRIRFEVVDTGHGISEHELELLFQPFVQTEAGRVTREGTGLGLAITQRLVELMGGKVTVASALGAGSTFAFDLALPPCAPVPVEAGTSPVVALAPGQEPPRIAVVDDAPENRALLARLLESVGIVVRTAENGEQAIALWREWRPALVFMDVRMPVLDGREATRRIRAEERASGLRPVAIIALTASVFESEGDVLRNDGMDEVIHKPYREESIFASISTHLGTRFRHEEAAADPANPPPPPRTAAGARVLVTDDDPIGRAVVRELLTDAGYDVVEAGDGAAALAQLAADPAIALVLLDVEMPTLGGIETVRRIRADARLAGLSVLAMTAHGDADDAARFASAGMSGHLPKPIDPRQLLDAVARRLGR